MAFGKILSATDISASGLAAERKRMEVVANNIANAHTTRSAEGGPYRRQTVVFSSLMDSASAPGAAPDMAGVKVVGVSKDSSPLPRVYQPGHPDADEDGFVEMPNVSLPNEMVDLMTASRAYEANLKSMQTFRSMAEQALSLLRGMR
jgi:flagellar basal-body rod protein FlgC